MEKFLINSPKHKFVKIMCMIVSLIAIVLIMVYVRAFYGSMRAFHQGETYLNERQYIRAITFFDRSIHWYTPFNPYIRQSCEGLWKIGNDAERQEDIKLALIAYRTIRRGFYSARSFYTPGKRWIEKCDLKIDELMQIEQAQKIDQDGLIKDKKVLIEKEKTISPNVFWTMILEIGFLGWIGSVIGFIVFGFRYKGESGGLIHTTLTWMVLTLVFFAIWIVGMVKA